MQDYASWLPLASIVMVCVYTVVFELGLGAIPDFIGSGKLLVNFGLCNPSGTIFFPSTAHFSIWTNDFGLKFLYGRI